MKTKTTKVSSKNYSKILQQSFLIFYAFLCTIEVFSQKETNIDSLIKLTKNCRSPRATFKAYEAVLLAYTEKNDYKSLQKTLNSGTKALNKFHSKQGYDAILINNYGACLLVLRKYDEAMENMLKAEKISKASKDSSTLLNIYTSIGNLFITIDKPQKAAVYYQKALSHSNPRFANSEENTTNLRFNLSVVYAMNKQYTLSLKELEKVEKVYQKIKDEEGLSFIYNNRSEIYTELGFHDLAIESSKKALALKIKTKSSAKEINAYTNLSYIYYKAHKYKESIECGNKSIEIGKRNGVTEKEYVLTYDYLSRSYAALGMHKEAYNSLLKLNEIKYSQDEIDNQNSVEKRELTNAFSEKMTVDSLRFTHKAQLKDLKLRKAKNERYFSILGLAFLSVVGIVFYRRFKASQEKNKIIAQQKTLVDEKNREIIDSINYAKSIQQSLLSNENHILKKFKNSGLYFEPKDIVSGDFYWAIEVKNFYFVAICDCTGHGVPGAFMSLLNISLLNEAVIEKNILEPNLILNHVRARLIENIPNANDGMDAILLRFEIVNSQINLEKTITYAAANNEPVVFRNNELIRYPKDKMPVGKGHSTTSFQNFNLEIIKNDLVVLATDGFGDQFGGPKNKKLRRENWVKILRDLSAEDQISMKNTLQKHFQNWKENNEQTDDVCVFSLKYSEC